MIEIGIKGYAEESVTEKNTASAMSSGDMDVYATPAMIALLESAALTGVQPYLEEGSSTVGTKVEVAHIAATPVGMKVRAEAELVETDRRRLVFKVEAFDEAGKIAEGTHERFIIDKEKFLAKANAKKSF